MSQGGEMSSAGPWYRKFRRASRLPEILATYSSTQHSLAITHNHRRPAENNVYSILFVHSAARQLHEVTATMILEEQRFLHEDLERLEAAIADRVTDEPRHVRERLNRDHQIAGFLDRKSVV